MSKKISAKEFGEALHVALHASYVDLDWLSGVTGIKRSDIGDYGFGRVLPNVATQHVLAATLGVDLSTLLYVERSTPFGRWLGAIVLAHRTQYNFADVAGINQSTVSHCLRTGTANLQTRRAIAIATGVSQGFIDDLIRQGTKQTETPKDTAAPKDANPFPKVVRVFGDGMSNDEIGIVVRSLSKSGIAVTIA
jgi:hypothetical protein